MLELAELRAMAALEWTLLTIEIGMTEQFNAL